MIYQTQRERQCEDCLGNSRANEHMFDCPVRIKRLEARIAELESEKKSHDFHCLSKSELVLDYQMRNAVLEKKLEVAVGALESISKKVEHLQPCDCNNWDCIAKEALKEIEGVK